MRSPREILSERTEISEEGQDLDIIQIKESQFEKAYGDAIDILAESAITIGGFDFIEVDINKKQQCSNKYKEYEKQVFRNVEKMNEESFEPVPQLTTCKNDDGSIVPRSILFPYGFYFPLKVDDNTWMMCNIQRDASAKCEYNFYISNNEYIRNQMDVPSPDYENRKIYFNFPERMMDV